MTEKLDQNRQRDSLGTDPTNRKVKQAHLDHFISVSEAAKDSISSHNKHSKVDLMVEKPPVMVVSVGIFRKHRLGGSFPLLPWATPMGGLGLLHNQEREHATKHVSVQESPLFLRRVPTFIDYQFTLHGVIDDTL